MTKENITHKVATCQECHKTYSVDEMQGFTCVYCGDMMLDETPKLEWDNEDAGKL